MKKLLLLFLLFPCLSVFSNELTEDYLDIATNYCISGKYTDAMSYIDKILKIEPYNSDAKELKNTLLRITNPYIQSYLSQINPTVRKAFDAKYRGNEREEILALSSSNDFWPNFLLARHYSLNKEHLNAINYYKKAISVKPDFSYSYLGIAKEYIASKNYNAAISSLNNYIAYNGNSDIAYALRAEAYMNSNNINQALSDIRTALSIEENISYLLIEAKILYYGGDYDKAREILNKLVRNVQTAEVYKYLGLCDYAQSDYTNALINLDKSIILSDDDKSIISIYNNIKMMLGESSNEKGIYHN